MKYKVKKIIDKVYLATFKEHYDLCMFFLRYQETYESPNPKFRNKPFKLLDFMEWYSNDRGGSFSYPLDWAGFNLSSSAIDNVFNLEILDWNKYDDEMDKLHYELTAKSDNYYLIGVSEETGKSTTIDHELAHAMFYTIPQYRKQMKRLISELPNPFINKVNRWLIDIGYTKQVFIDETQAYMSTGFPDDFKVGWRRESKPFVKVFNEFKKDKVRNSS